MKLRGALCAAMFLIMGGCIFAEEEVPVSGANNATPGDMGVSLPDQSMLDQGVPDQGVVEPGDAAADLEQDMAPRVCATPCGAGEECCDGQCVKLAGNKEHCGGCGIRCDEGELCTESGYCLCGADKTAAAPVEFPLERDAKGLFVLPYYGLERFLGEGMNREIIDDPHAANMTVVQHFGDDGLKISTLDGYGRPFAGTSELITRLEKIGGGPKGTIRRVEAHATDSGVLVMVHREIILTQQSIEAHVFNKVGKQFVKIAASNVITNKAIKSFGTKLIGERVIVSYIASEVGLPKLYIATTPSAEQSNAMWTQNTSYTLGVDEDAEPYSKMSLEVLPDARPGVTADKLMGFDVAVSWYDVDQSRQMTIRLLTGKALTNTSLQLENTNIEKAFMTRILPPGVNPLLAVQTIVEREYDSEDPVWLLYGPDYGQNLSSLGLTYTKGPVIPFASTTTGIMFSPGPAGSDAQERFIISWLNGARGQGPSIDQFRGEAEYVRWSITSNLPTKKLSTQKFARLFAAQVSLDTLIISGERVASNDTERALVFFPLYKGEPVCTPSGDAMASN